MNIMFETQLALTSVEGNVHFAQERARLDAEPVFKPDATMDGNVAQINTVLKDQGMYRMWYLCAPAFVKSDMEHIRYRVAYAESDNGLTWRRPKLGLVKDGPAGNNYIDLNIAAVFIDPQAPSAARYRGVVYAPHPLGKQAGPKGQTSCFYTAHSADGFHWELDAREPRWWSGDTITCVYHPQRERGIAAMKFVRLYGGIHRRAIWTANLFHDAWEEDPVCALVPDDFDDIAAKARGFNSTDFYQMGMLPAGIGMVGFIENFRHWLPLSELPQHYAIYGMSDVTLAYQHQPQGQWIHAPGRPNFIGDDRPSWALGWLQIANAPVEAGKEHWLFVSGNRYSHAWAYNLDWKVNPRWNQIQETSGNLTVIGAARWPAWRLFGFHAVPDGALEVDLGAIQQPSMLALNYKTSPQGSLRVQLFARVGRGDKEEIKHRSEWDACVPLSGDALSGIVVWKDGARIDPVPGKRIVARITMEDAVLYAWEWRPAA